MEGKKKYGFVMLEFINKQNKIIKTKNNIKKNIVIEEMNKNLKFN